MRALLLVTLALAGCDDDGGGEVTPDAAAPADAGADTGPFPDAAPDAAVDAAPEVDEAAPELRDVRVRFEGSMLDLNTGDAEWTLPRPVEAVFTVLARDDVSDADALTVEVVDADGAALPDQRAELRNGLWEVTVGVEPEGRYHVRVADAAGNAALSEHALALRAFADIIPGAWATRFYDADQRVTDRWETVFGVDGTWARTRGDVEVAGRWSIDGDLLVMEWRTSTDPQAPDADADTVERRRESTFYLDGRAFETTPFERAEGGEGPEGVWTRAAREVTPAGDRSWTVTLTLAEDGTFTEVWSGDVERTRAGTWAWELSENYTQSNGDFLARTVESVDGAPLETPEQRFELAQLHGDWLLVTPMLRTEE